MLGLKEHNTTSEEALKNLSKVFYKVKDSARLMEAVLTLKGGEGGKLSREVMPEATRKDIADLAQWIAKKTSEADRQHPIGRPEEVDNWLVQPKFPLLTRPLFLWLKSRSMKEPKKNLAEVCKACKLPEMAAVPDPRSPRSDREEREGRITREQAIDRMGQGEFQAMLEAAAQGEPFPADSRPEAKAESEESEEGEAGTEGELEDSESSGEGDN